MRNIIRQFIVWYVMKYENGRFDVKRRAGAEQTCKIFSKQAYENVVKKAIEHGGKLYTQEQLNRVVEATAKAVIECGEDSDCNVCYLQIGTDDCVLQHIKS